MSDPTSPSILTVAIVGRPNVGKSALFNRLAGRDLALVYDQPGVTRDPLIANCQWKGVSYQLIDTGGIAFPETPLDQAVREQAFLAASTAQHILFVVDGRSGLHPLDQEIALWFRKNCSTQRITLVVNKIDSEKQKLLIDDFHALAIDDIQAVSAAHSIGIRELRDKIVQPYLKQLHQIPPPTAAETSRIVPFRIAIIGKPNVGKSSLINALTKTTRAIVSPTPGTTRDNLDIPFTWKDKHFLLIDTAGMRSRSHISDPLESLTTSRSAHAINRSHLSILLLDTDRGVTTQDKKIAGLIQKSRRPSIIAVNKWDKLKEAPNHTTASPQAWREAIQRELFFLNYAPICLISAQTHAGLTELMHTLVQVQENLTHTIPTSLLNRIISEAIQKQPPPTKKGSKKLKIYFVSQRTSEESGPFSPQLAMLCE